jgi:hypothetical protein
MAALAGWDAAIYVSHDAVPVTGEAMTVTSGNEYIINDIDRRIIDPETAYTVYENGIATVQNIVVDALAGTVEFAGPATTPVTIDYSYRPLAAIGCPREVSFETMREMGETTCMKLTGTTDAGVRRFIQLIKDASGSFKDIDVATDLFTGLTLQELIEATTTNEYYVLKIQFALEKIFVAWIVFTESSIEATYDGLVEGTVSWELASSDGFGHFTFVDYVADI